MNLDSADLCCFHYAVLGSARLDLLRLQLLQCRTDGLEITAPFCPYFSVEASSESFFLFPLLWTV